MNRWIESIVLKANEEIAALRRELDAETARLRSECERQVNLSAAACLEAIRAVERQRDFEISRARKASPKAEVRHADAARL